MNLPFAVVISVALVCGTVLVAIKILLKEFKNE